MKKYLYFLKASETPPDCPRLQRAYGFRPDGSWCGLPLPRDAAGLVLEDRCLPSPGGLAAALKALSGWEGLLLLDFERPPTPLLIRLAQDLAGRTLIVPPSYAAWPHRAILVGPWPGYGCFQTWLQRQQARWGSMVLDAAPIRLRASPGGGRPMFWRGSLPQSGFPCPGAGCLHRRLEDGSVLFWDTAQTLTERCRDAGVPALVFSEDWAALSPAPPKASVKKP
ncbi:MAG: hypothetical protein J5878_05460 [Oscillospiraceae bacterium]|nr:hypothetical protein [Oscillospiraceae bacterium]